MRRIFLHATWGLLQRGRNGLPSLGNVCRRAMYRGHQISHGAVRLQVVSECDVQTHPIAVSASIAFSLNHTACFQISQDFQNRPLGDPDLLG